MNILQWITAIAMILTFTLLCYHLIQIRRFFTITTQRFEAQRWRMNAHAERLTNLEGETSKRGHTHE